MRTWYSISAVVTLGVLLSVMIAGCPKSFDSPECVDTGCDIIANDCCAVGSTAGNCIERQAGVTSCIPAGAKAAFETCDSDNDCTRGMCLCQDVACKSHVCSLLCRADSDCADVGGGCAPSIEVPGVSYCTCPKGTNACPGGCVDLDSDPKHCGSCDRPCVANRSCVSGSCVCDSPLAECPDGKCHDLGLDAQNCGACGTECKNGRICAAKSCECAPGSMTCTDNCVSCPAGKFGVCATNRPSRCCPDGTHFCDVAGPPTGCFDGMSVPDCATVAQCGDGSWHVCASGYVVRCGPPQHSLCCAAADTPHFDSNNQQCCTTGYPFFCNVAGAPCFAANNQGQPPDCSTVVFCNNQWNACPQGYHYDCNTQKCI